MKTTLITPKSSILKKFIQYFCFVENVDEKYDKSVVCYPNTNYCLGIHKGNKVVRLSDLKYKLASHNNFHSYLTGIYQTPMHLHYSGAFSGVWINFEPLGLEMLSGRKISENLFIQDAIETSLPQNWQTMYDVAFSTNNPHSNAEKLERFFLQILPTKNKFEYIPFNEVSVSKVDDLKGIHYMSYSSINRLYKNTLNISPKEFLNIQRFRRSVRQIHSIEKLTDIAYKEGFSDQSHMVRSFRRYTGISTKEFRKQSKIVQCKICFSME